MDEYRKKIAKLTLKLREQTCVPLWSVAHEDLIYAIATEQKVSWGPRTKKIHTLLKIAYKLKMTDIVIFVLSFYFVFNYWKNIKIKTFTNKIKIREIKRIFFGFGASSEEYLYLDYVKKSSQVSLRIDSFSLKGMEEIRCPNLFNIFFTLLGIANGYTSKLQKAKTPEISSYIIDFLVVGALNAGLYSFYRIFWKSAKLQGLQEATFLAMNISAYACVDEKIKTIYLQHGLISLSILIPKISRIDVLTSEEERYFSTVLKDIMIQKVTSNKIPDHANKKNILLVLSPNIFLEKRLPILELMLDWAKNAKLQIVIRNTLKVTQQELSIIQARFPFVTFDDLNHSLHESYVKWNPKFVVSWTSTGLATALDYSILPISLDEPTETSQAWSMIYPMKQRVLFWPRDEQTIFNAIQSESIYFHLLEKLCNYQQSYA